MASADGIGLHMGIGEEDDAARGDHQAHRRELAHPRRQPDDVADMAQLGAVAALEPADHGVGLAAPHGDRRDHRGRGAHQRARRVRRDAAPAGDLDIGCDIVAVARIVLRVDDVESRVPGRIVRP